MKVKPILPFLFALLFSLQCYKSTTRIDVSSSDYSGTPSEVHAVLKDNAIQISGDTLNTAFASPLDWMRRFQRRLVEIKKLSDSSMKSKRVYSSTDGINWTLVTENATFTNGGSGTNWGMTSTSFDGKMWLIAYSNYSGDSKRVYSSTDGINWTLVTENATFTNGGSGTNWGMTAIGTLTDMYLVSYSNYSGDSKRVFKTTAK